MNIGENMRIIRENLKLSRNKVQELTGIHYQYLGEIERGDKNPSLEILIKLGKAYNVTISELIGEVSLYNSKLNSLLKKLKYTDKMDVLKLLKSFEGLSRSDIEILLKLITEFKT